MTQTAIITHQPPRVIDGSGRMTPGHFRAAMGKNVYAASYSASALDDGRDDIRTMQEAHALCMDWVARQMGVSE